MRKFFAIIIATTGLVLSAEKGVERILDAEHYGFWRRHSGLVLTGFGYKLMPVGCHMYGYKNDTIDSWESAQEFPRYASWKNNPNIVVRSLVGDIQQSILDSDRFWSAIHAQRYGDAWKMGAANPHEEQRILWKDSALNAAQEKMKALMRESVLEEDQDALEQAFTILRSFENTAVHPVLIFYMESQENKFEQKKNRLLSSPALSALTADLRRNVVDRLLEGM